jgi:tryptophan halogenase
VAIAGAVLQRDAPDPARFLGGGTGEGREHGRALARDGQRAVAGQLVAPVVVAGVQGAFDQQAAKARAIDEQVTLDPAPVAQLDGGDEAGFGVLLDSLDAEALDEPRQLRFVTGRRRKSWVKNCIAIGLAAGFVEPLESTSIHLIETAVGKLIELFPDRDCRPELADEFNRAMGIRYESVRDFIILHYKLTKRDDSEFWRYCANMPIPDSLRHQIELFRETGRVAILDPNGFAEPSFVAMLMGLGVVPKRYDPFVDAVDIREVHGHFAGVRDMIAQAVARLPEHGAYVDAQRQRATA